MARVMLVGTDSELTQRLIQCSGSAQMHLETTGWADWPRHGCRGTRLQAALLDLTAAGAPGVEQIVESYAWHRGLRLVLVVNSDLVRSQALQRLLQSRRVDFVRVPVDADEVWQRVRRLVGAAGVLAKAMPDPATSAWRMKIGRRPLDRQPARMRSSPARASVRASGAASPNSLTVGSSLRHVVPEIHDPDSGRLDARKIGALFGISLADIARLLGRELSAVHKTSDAPSLQSGLALFERVAAPLLYLAGSPENLRIWLNAPNPDLEDEAPLALLKSGEGEVVAELLEDALVGQPG